LLGGVAGTRGGAPVTGQRLCIHGCRSRGPGFAWTLKPVHPAHSKRLTDLGSLILVSEHPATLRAAAGRGPACSNAGSGCGLNVLVRKPCHTVRVLRDRVFRRGTMEKRETCTVRSSVVGVARCTFEFDRRWSGPLRAGDLFSTGVEYTLFTR
jgi:hypothetical protein